MTVSRVVAAIFFLVVANVTCAAQAREQGKRGSPIVLTIEMATKGAVYRIDQKDITRDPLRGIAQAKEKHGGSINYPLLVIIDEKLPINILDEAMGLVGKVGFVNARYFRLSSNKMKIAELSFGRVYPYPSSLSSLGAEHTQR